MIRCRLALVCGTLLLPVVLLTAAAEADDSNARKKVQSLTAEQLAELRRSHDRFSKMSPAEQQRIRALHEQLRKHEKAGELSRVLEKYSAWLRSLPANQRAELLSLTGEERVKKMRKIIEDQERERFLRLAADQLKPGDHGVLLAWIRELALARREQLVAQIPEEYRSRFDASSQREQEGMLTFTLLRKPEKLEIEDAELNKLNQTLSDTAKTALANADEAEEKTLLLRQWVRMAFFSRIRSNFSRPPVPEEKLTEFYQTLDEKQREYLNSLSSEKMKDELQIMYHNRNWLGRRRGGPGRGGPGRAGPGRGGRGGGPPFGAGKFPSGGKPPGEKKNGERKKDGGEKRDGAEKKDGEKKDSDAR